MTQNSCTKFKQSVRDFSRHKYEAIIYVWSQFRITKALIFHVSLFLCRARRKILSMYVILPGKTAYHKGRRIIDYNRQVKKSWRQRRNTSCGTDIWRLLSKRTFAFFINVELMRLIWEFPSSLTIVCKSHNFIFVEIGKGEKVQNSKNIFSG